MMNQIKFQDTSVHWSVYHRCVTGIADYETGKYIDLDGYKESPTGCPWATTQTLTSESFVVLWQTSLDEIDFVKRLQHLQQLNPSFRMWNWNARANRLRKQGVELQQFPSERTRKKTARLKALKKLAKSEKSS